ncbi:hypothetical protein ZWY2020_043907 [Hordeum vulgare]|nr:hypothetical protein ZWY2020_043907 [Hordeum vulgare]
MQSSIFSRANLQRASSVEARCSRAAPDAWAIASASGLPSLDCGASIDLLPATADAPHRLSPSVRSMRSAANASPTPSAMDSQWAPLAAVTRTDCAETSSEKMPEVSFAPLAVVRRGTPLRKGFLAASTPEMLHRCRLGPGTSSLRTPGDTLLHYTLSNFSSPVATVGDKRKPLTDVDVICHDSRGRSLGKVVSDDIEVMRVLERFDSGEALSQLGKAAPPLLLLPSPPTVIVASPAPAADVAAMEPPALSLRGKAPCVYTMRSARLRSSEQATRLSMLEKATLLKKQRLNGKPSASSTSLLPADDLLQLAAEGSPPLDRMKVMQFAGACGISEIDLNKVAPEYFDV